MAVEEARVDYSEGRERDESHAEHHAVCVQIALLVTHPFVKSVVAFEAKPKPYRKTEAKSNTQDYSHHSQTKNNAATALLQL